MCVMLFVAQRCSPLHLCLKFPLVILEKVGHVSLKVSVPLRLDKLLTAPVVLSQKQHGKPMWCWVIIKIVRGDWHHDP